LRLVDGPRTPEIEVPTAEVSRATRALREITFDIAILGDLRTAVPALAYIRSDHWELSALLLRCCGMRTNERSVEPVSVS
jgi:hypothetical protein